MNIEETKRAIEVMQAFVDGKRVESDSLGAWIVVDNPIWAWEEFDYRIAPEPEHIQIIKNFLEHPWFSVTAQAREYLKREGY